MSGTTNTHGNAALLPKSATSPVLPCQKNVADPIVDEQLQCFDAEKTGARRYDTVSGALNIVQTEPSDEIVITYTGPKIPHALSVTRDGVKMPDATGGGTYRYKVAFTPAANPYGRALTTSWEDLATWSHTPVEYVFSSPDLPRSITVRAYNPDQWKFTYKPPPSRSFSLGAKLDNSQSTQQITLQNVAGEPALTYVASQSSSGSVTISKSTGGNFTSAKTTANIEASYSQYVAQLSSPDLWVMASGQRTAVTASASTEKSNIFEDLPFSLTCNGRYVEFDIIEVIGVLIKIIKMFEDISKLIAAVKAPHIGWYLDMSVKFLEGEITLAWGWREYKDYRAYYYVGIEEKLTLFDVHIEVGVGVECTSDFKGQLCVGFTGAANLSVSPMEFGSPEKKETGFPIDLGTVKSTITVGAYGQVLAGALLQITGSAEIPLDVTMVNEIETGWHFHTTVTASSKGLVLTLKVKSLWITYSPSVEVLTPGTLGSFEFPNPEDKLPDEITSRDQISDIMKDTLSSGWWPVQFYMDVPLENPHWYKSYDEVEISTKEVADNVADRIWAQKDNIELEKKVIDGIAQSVRKACEGIAHGLVSKHLSVVRMRTYLDGPDFQAVLQAAFSPSKQYRKQLSGHG